MIEKPDRLSPLQLAFIGDAVFEVSVRTYLLEQCVCPPAELHRRSTAMVCANAQAKAAKAVLEQLSEQELAVFKRGRNAHPGHSPKHASSADYAYATGLECLFGYLHLSGQKQRMEQLFKMVLDSIQ